MARPFSPLNRFTRQARFRVLNDDGTVGPAPAGLTVTGIVVAAATEDAAADALIADSSWTAPGSYIGTYTDATGLLWGVYQLVIDGAVITVAKTDTAFPDGIYPFFRVHIDGTVHALEQMVYNRGRKATLA